MKSAFNLVLVLFLGLSLSGAASAQQVQAMKLLTAQVGWAQSGPDHLYWTRDGGAHWKDIVPPKAPEESLGGIFFLDASSGWVMLSHPDDKAEQQFRLASTRDAGATWSSSPMKLPWKRYAEDFAGGASIFFLDRVHGWLSLELYHGSSVAPALLLATQDGGKTWEVPRGDSGKAGSLCFFNQSDGLLSGGVANSELWTTHDGSKSWKQLSLKAPHSAAPAEFATYGEPTCRTSKSGFLPVTYSGPDSSDSALVLFTTSDAGRTWKPGSVVPHLEEMSPGQTVPSTFVGSTLIAAIESEGKVTLTIFSPGGDVRRVALNGFKMIFDLSFFDTSHGWASTNNGMFSTTNGGASWTEITPTRTVSPHDPKAN